MIKTLPYHKVLDSADTPVWKLLNKIISDHALSITLLNVCNKCSNHSASLYQGFNAELEIKCLQLPQVSV